MQQHKLNNTKVPTKAGAHLNHFLDVSVVRNLSTREVVDGAAVQLGRRLISIRLADLHVSVLLDGTAHGHWQIDFVENCW